MTMWSPDSWQQKTTLQQPDYPDKHAVSNTVAALFALPPLVSCAEIHALKQQLAEAARGERFILQGGDCAESFAQTTESNITGKLSILLKLSLLLQSGLGKPVSIVGRIAGQYAKPRSQDFETHNAKDLPSYRGDLVHSAEKRADARVPNPDNMQKGYFHSAATLNVIRRHAANQFSQLCSQSSAASFYTSHEALLLPYEQALTRKVDGKWYDFSTHFPWIGMRTNDLNGGHVEFLKGVENPIAIKIGPEADEFYLQGLLEILNPNDEPGRVTLITRFGADKIESCLPKLINAVNSMGKSVLWSCDPMHGNTQLTSGGIKTRRFDDILSELQQAFSIHQQCHSHLGGVHIELTGEAVTECLGGAGGVSEADLTRAYESLVDPRLNYQQAIELAELVVSTLNEIQG